MNTSFFVFSITSLFFLANSLDCDNPLLDLIEEEEYLLASSQDVSSSCSLVTGSVCCTEEYFDNFQDTIDSLKNSAFSWLEEAQAILELYSARIIMLDELLKEKPSSPLVKWGLKSYTEYLLSDLSYFNQLMELSMEARANCFYHVWEHLATTSCLVCSSSIPDGVEVSSSKKEISMSLNYDEAMEIFSSECQTFVRAFTQISGSSEYFDDTLRYYLNYNLDNTTEAALDEADESSVSTRSCGEYFSCNLLAQDVLLPHGVDIEPLNMDLAHVDSFNSLLEKLFKVVDGNSDSDVDISSRMLGADQLERIKGEFKKRRLDLENDGRRLIEENSQMRALESQYDYYTELVSDDGIKSFTVGEELGYNYTEKSLTISLGRSVLKWASASLILFLMIFKF